MTNRWPDRIRAGAIFLLLLDLAIAAETSAVTYVDIAQTAGLTVRNVCGSTDKKLCTLEVTGNGCAFFDFDRDRWMDILLVSGSTLERYPQGGDPLCSLYRNNGKKQFIDVTTKAGMTRRGWGMGVSIADIDNDGWEDVYLTGFGENVLYRNNGNGTFTDITKKAGVTDGGWSTGSAFADFDRDGHVDLFVTHYLQLDLQKLPRYGAGPFCKYRGIPVHCGPKGLEGETGRLYRNNGDGSFTDVSLKAGILQERRFYGFTPVWTDFDDDGWPDLFVANDSTPNLLYRNNRDGKFTEVALQAGVAVSDDGREQACMGADVGDYDGDGLPDLFVTNFSDDYYTLYHHEADNRFIDVSTRSGIGTATWNYLGWGTGFLDYDNDGLLDIFCSNGHIYPEVDGYKFGTRYRQRNQLLRNLGSGKFRDLGREAGTGLLVEKSSRGSACSDFDNDGDVDILIVNINDAPTLLENRGGNRKHWIGFLAEGKTSNRSALGARVRVRAGSRLWIAEVRSGGSYISQNDRRVHFGLGNAANVDSVEIRWPDGTVEELGGLASDRYYLLRPGEQAVALKNANAFILPSP